jgi:hypothetical protein
MNRTSEDAIEIELVEAAPNGETLEEVWFAEQRSSVSSLPPSRRSSVPPIGDADVDPWLR